jgi:prepilin-type N-terminal cleavage/methylation domain-containing protein
LLARRGFTLAELVIVVLIIGILTAMATPKFAASLKRAQADAACLRVKADLNLARQTAISRSTTQSVQFIANSAVYTLPGIADLDNPALAAYSVNLAEGEYRAVVTAASFGAGATVQFDRYGQAIDGGSVTISAGGIMKTISVDATSGAVTIL